MTRKDLLSRVGVVGLVTVVGVWAAGDASAAKPGGGSTTTLVNSAVSDFDSGVAPALQIQSDQAGTYFPSATLKSEFINNGGTWAIDSYYVAGATRTIWLDFSEGIPNTGPGAGDPVSPPSGYYKARIGSECFRVGNNFLTLLPGQTMVCPMNVHFDYGGRTYDLHMAVQNANFTETESANVTCISPTSGSAPCTQWRLWPTGTYVPVGEAARQANVANLSYETSVKGKIAYVKQGNFHISFSILIVKP
jgi:hypothetical protein